MLTVFTNYLGADREMPESIRAIPWKTAASAVAASAGASNVTLPSAVGRTWMREKSSRTAAALPRR